MQRRKFFILALIAALGLSYGLGRALLTRKAEQKALQQSAAPQVVTMRLQPGEVLTVQKRVLPLGVPVAGALQALAVANIKSYASGTLYDLSVREGDSVAAGQVLARVDPSDANSRLRQTQQEAEAAHAQQVIEQRLHSNNQALVEQGFISQTALRTSAANLAAAKARYQAALAAVELARKAVGDTVLRSPINGQVARRLANNGERVTIESPVLEIVDLRELELQAPLSPADSLQVRPGQQARLQLDGSPLEISAKVVRLSPKADSATRSVSVYLRLLPPATTQAPILRPGLFLKGQIDLDSSQAQPVVPLDSVRTDKPLPYLQLLTRADTDKYAIAQRTVTLGARALIDGKTWVAVPDLAEGSQIVAASAGALGEGTLVRIAPATE